MSSINTLENIRNIIRNIVEQSNLSDKQFSETVSKSFIELAKNLGAGEKELAELSDNFEKLNDLTKDSDIQELATQLEEVSTKLGELGDTKSLAIVGV